MASRRPFQGRAGDLSEPLTGTVVRGRGSQFDSPVFLNAFLRSAFPSDASYFKPAVFLEVLGQRGIFEHGDNFTGHVFDVPEVDLKGMCQHFAHARCLADEHRNAMTHGFKRSNAKRF